ERGHQQTERCAPPAQHLIGEDGPKRDHRATTDDPDADADDDSADEAVVTDEGDALGDVAEGRGPIDALALPASRARDWQTEDDQRRYEERQPVDPQREELPIDVQGGEGAEAAEPYRGVREQRESEGGQWERPERGEETERVRRRELLRVDEVRDGCVFRRTRQQRED